MNLRIAMGVIRCVVSRIVISASAFLLALVLFSPCALYAAEPPETAQSREKERLKILAQKIDSVVVWEFTIKGKKPEKKGRMDMMIRYDKNGNIMEKGFYNKGEIDTKQAFKYDEQNRLVEEIALTQFGSPGSSWKYRYDDKGRVVESAYFTELSSANQRKTFHYRDGLFTANDGALVEMKFYVSAKKVGYRDVYSYNDTTKRCVKTTRFRADDSIESKEEYEYDAAGNLREIRFYSDMEYDEKSAKLIWKKIFTYDAKGNLVEEVEFNSKGKMNAKQTHAYDAQGRLAETTIFEAKKPPFKPAYIRKYVYTTSI
jgi:uncharacterized protein RhaS with RHS repeats